MRNAIAAIGLLVVPAALAAAAHADDPPGAPPATSATSSPPVAAKDSTTPAPTDATKPAPPETPPAPRCFGLEVPTLEFATQKIDWRVGAYAAFDLAAFGPDNRRDDGFYTTDFRPIVEANTGPFSLRVEADLVGVDTPRNLYEAYAAWQATPWLRASAGQFRVALGSEFATHERDLPWIGYGFASHLDGRYDVGVRADGTLTDGLWYQAAAVAGHGFDLDGHRRTSPQLSLRGVLHPLRAIGATHKGAQGALQGLHLGLGLAHLSDGDDPVHLWTPLQSRVFDTPDLDGDSGRWVHMELGFVSGPFQLGFERTVGSIDDVPVPGGDANIDQLTGFAWGAALNLTGEPRGWRDGAFVPSLVPAGSPRSSGALLGFLPDGRWEASLRYSNGDIDRDLFDAGYATYDVSSQETRTVTAAVFWEPCDRLRLGLAWVKTHADQEIAAFGLDNRDSSFVLRFEIRF